MLRLQSHLASAGRIRPEQVVGTPLETKLDAQKYRPNLTFALPSSDSETRQTLERTANKSTENAQLLNAQIGGNRSEAEGPGETDVSGVYESWLSQNAGPMEVRRFALNVDSRERRRCPRGTAAASITARTGSGSIHSSRGSAVRLRRSGRLNHSMQILWILLAVLLAEQMMSYFSSYHPPRVEAHDDRHADDRHFGDCGRRSYFVPPIAATNDDRMVALAAACGILLTRRRIRSFHVSAGWSRNARAGLRTARGISNSRVRRNSGILSGLGTADRSGAS